MVGFHGPWVISGLGEIWQVSIWVMVFAWPEIFVTTDSTTIEILDLTIIEISVIADVASEAMYIVHVLTFQYMIAQAFSSC